MSRIKSEIHKKLLDSKEALFIFDYLQKNISWQDGIKSKSGFTRYAKSLEVTEDPIVEHIIVKTITELSKKSKNKINNHIEIFGVYLNYYINETNWTPNHKHPGTTQVVISLGGTRKFILGKKEYNVSNGDVAIFGSSIHGIPKQEKAKPRISIAFFCKIN